MSTVILRISPRFCRGRLSPSPSDLLVPFSLLSGPFCPQQPSLSVSLLSYISFLFPLVTAGIGVKRKHIKLNLKFCRNSAFGLKLKDTQPEPAGERNLWLLLCSHYTISFGYTSLRRNLAPGYAETGMRRYNARSAVIIPCRAVWCPEGSLRFYNFCSFNACFSVLPDCLQIVAGF